MRITKEYLDTLAAKSGLSRDTIRCRLKSGWSEERILATPLDEARSKAASKNAAQRQKESASDTITRLALENNICRHTLSSRLSRGWTIEEATTRPPQNRRAIKSGEQPPPPPPSEFAALTKTLSPFARHFCGIAI